MLGIPLKYNLRNLAVRRAATVMTAFGIALPTAVFCSVLALQNGLDTTLRQTGSPDTIVFLRRSSMSETNSSVTREEAPVVETLLEVAREPGSGKALASREVMVLLNLPRRSGGGMSNVAIRGTTETGRSFRDEVKLIDGRWPGTGLAEVAVARGIAERFENCSLGARLPLGKRDWRVVGVFDAGATAYGSEVWGDADAVAAEFRREAWSAIWVRARPAPLKRADEWERAGHLRRDGSGGAAVPVSEREELQLAPSSLVSEAGLSLLRAPRTDTRLKGLEAFTECDYFRQQTQLGSPIAGIGAFVAFFMAIGAAFAVMNTMYAAVSHRNREIAVLRAIGYPRRSVLASFLTESVILAVLGSAAGALGSFVVHGISTGTVNFSTMSEITFAFRVNPSVVMRGLFFGTLLGAVGGLLPAIRAARQPVAATMRAI